MTDKLIDWLVNRPKNEPSSRFVYGRLAGIGGICVNLLLFAAKVTIGLLTASVSISADAFNNLSDAGSSIVTLVGFRLSSAPPDREHPFGHGRMEYLTAMGIAILIVLAGVELGKSSFNRILQPEATAFGWVAAVVLVLSILMKVWLAAFYRAIGRRIHSEALTAAAADSRNDVLCTSVVLVSSVIAFYTNISMDGYIGLGVAAFIVLSGLKMIKDTVSPLLGQAPDPELVTRIRETVMAHSEIVGIHDLIVHNYGPSQCMITLHAEVSAEEDMMRSHDVIDTIEKEIMDKFQAIACIHMDPVDTHDSRIGALRDFVEQLLRDIEPEADMHDFRVVFGETHTNLIFDITVPFHYANTCELSTTLQQRVWEKDPQLFTVATVEHSFLG